MLMNLLLLIQFLSYFTVHATESTDETITTAENHNATETITPSLKSKPLSLGGGKNLPCLRLYSGPNQLGDWFDICSSNELLSSVYVWRPLSMCTSGNRYSFNRKRYWLLYEKQHFLGSYILIGPGQCINNINQYKLKAITSILTCVESIQNEVEVYVSCQYPRRPWREFFQISGYPDDKTNSKDIDEIQHKSADDEEAAISSLLDSLDELMKNSMNNK
ncbi:unnamed protein product [Schistosoma turkestanicum]|nr:unnamed protein product [Schistosoma turkestanicum]